MRRYAPAPFVVARAFVNERVHASNETIGAEAGFSVRSAPELAIDYFADAFQHAAHDSLRDDRVAPALRGLVLLVSHK